MRKKRKEKNNENLDVFSSFGSNAGSVSEVCLSVTSLQYFTVCLVINHFSMRFHVLKSCHKFLWLMKSAFFSPVDACIGLTCRLSASVRVTHQTFFHSFCIKEWHKITLNTFYCMCPNFHESRSKNLRNIFETVKAQINQGLNGWKKLMGW